MEAQVHRSHITNQNIIFQILRKFLTHNGRLVIQAIFAICYFTVADKLRNIKISL